MTTLSPDQIERRVERMMDSIDRRFMAGTMSQDDYNKEVRDLNQWAEAKYSEVADRRVADIKAGRITEGPALLAHHLNGGFRR